MTSHSAWHRRSATAVIAVALAAAVAPIGCNRETPRAVDEATDPPPTHEDGAGEDSASAAEVELRIVTPEEFEQTLQGLRGQVVLVDFWATWCAPCVAQFPHTVALSRRHRDAGLTVVSMSLDEPDDAPQVREFLQRQGAEFVNLQSDLGVGAEAFERFDLDAVPHYRLYDRAGEVQLDAGGDPEDLELDQRVVELLAED